MQCWYSHYGNSVEVLRKLKLSHDGCQRLGEGCEEMLRCLSEDIVSVTQEE
jgi:hypothetical protein